MVTEFLPTVEKNGDVADNTSGSSEYVLAPVSSYKGFDDNVQSDVRNLARTMTNNSSHELVKYLTNMSQVPGVVPFDTLEVHDPQLDPESDQFSAKFWVKNLRKLLDSDPDYYKRATLGVAYRDLRAYGIATDSDYQATVSNLPMKLASNVLHSMRKLDPASTFDILKPMDAIMKPGEVTVVLGRPGSGCSTLLKTIATNTYGFHIDKKSKISYDGISPTEIQKHFRGSVAYSAETDVHFPHLHVGDTLEFAARLRTPQNRGDVDRETYAKHMASVYMAMYGLSHTRHTNVGNDFIRGVSGGERKRVSIAEVSLCGANLQCWDNATRGLDAATALEFIKALKTSATVLEATPLIAIYQCSQDAYDLFDKACVLYEGYQIYFGPGHEARRFFEEMGYECPQRQTTADYLTSLTNPAERIVRPGYENKVPRTAEEFEQYWKKSPEYARLTGEIDEYLERVVAQNAKQTYHDSHVARQSKHISSSSPYTVSFFMQTRYIMSRNILRFKGDPSIPLFSIFGQVIMGLILSSVFYNLRADTGSFYYRGSAMFFAVLFNAFSSLLEIMSLFEARPIVEKHRKYALYRPSADALASIITELPVKFAMSLGFNLVFYFMVNFRRNPGRFFFYWLMCVVCTFVMSHLFRSLGAVSTSLAGAMTPANVLLLAMVIFTGFVIPTPKMLGWSRWIGYINPVGYVFEALMANEFDGRQFLCSTYLPLGPGYDDLTGDLRVCNTVGSVSGDKFVSGTRYIKKAYNYTITTKWRNFGIAVAFAIFFLGIYISLTEFNRGAMQKGEITLFIRSALRRRRKEAKATRDLEGGKTTSYLLQDEVKESSSLTDRPGSDSQNYDEKNEVLKAPVNENIFHWRNLTYEVKIKAEHRVILNHVDGWVKPGQLTALMGASGAGKTTLLNCLSERLTTGVVTDGTRMVNGHSLDSSFQRSIGYVQQQDLHLPTSTVREAFRFSAYLRQPSHVLKAEKDEYVEYVINLLEMYDYADAVVGVAGEGLNVEQRKRLTIGVELVAKPKLLLFLDEPTSGLDSQTAWSVCKLIRKLADHGQAILCTIHQPSAILLKEFDRLLFLQKGGQTVYFGDMGEGCATLINYFEKYGAPPCPKSANPAEWILEVVGAAPGSHANQDYFEVWRNSTEYQAVQNELNRMESELSLLPRDESAESHKKYAAPIWKQYLIVSHRVLQQNWRTPMYIYSKLFLVVSSALFIGFSFFKANNTMGGLQNQMFGTFMFFIVFNTLVQQMLPYFVRQRDIYEVREAPSRTYSWFTFITAQVTGEVPFQIAVGTVAFFSWYYPIGLYRNAEPSDTVNSRGVLMWLLICSFMVYTSTMGQLCISFNEIADNAANLAVMLFTMCLNFCGVLAGPDKLPGFWIFMYRCNPFTYLIQGILATGLAKTSVTCAAEEYVPLVPPNGETCQKFLGPYISAAGGYILDPQSTTKCLYCQMAKTDDFLRSINSFYGDRWRNFGIFNAFTIFNIAATVFFYWLARVPKGTREKKHKE